MMLWKPFRFSKKHYNIRFFGTWGRTVSYIFVFGIVGDNLCFPSQLGWWCTDQFWNYLSSFFVMVIKFLGHTYEQLWNCLIWFMPLDIIFRFYACMEHYLDWYLSKRFLDMEQFLVLALSEIVFLTVFTFSGWWCRDQFLNCLSSSLWWS